MFQTTVIRIPRFGIARVLTYLAAFCFGFRYSNFRILFRLASWRDEPWCSRSVEHLRGKNLMHRLGTIVAVLTLITFVAGCTATPASRFYTLSATSGPAAPSSNLSIAVGPVTVPAVIDRPQIVVNAGANQVRLDEFNRWAAPLQNNIARVVAENLVAMLGTPRVTLSSADADYRAAIEVQSFESSPGEAAMLDAVWTVRRTRDGKGETGRTTVRETVQEKSYAALAAAHSRAVARLSQDLAAAVGALDRSGQ
jgi:uncharacterized lipoprotein YmbA